MSLVCVSVSFKNCPTRIRERFHLDGGKLTQAYQQFRGRSESLQCVNELVILSTCNRTEVYCHLAKSHLTIETFVAALGCLLFGEEVSEEGYWAEVAGVLTGECAVRHLCRVASGMESLVLGEPQVLGQVSEALKLAIASRACGQVLRKLFQTGVKSGRRARHETEINRHSLNASTIAVDLAARELGALSGKTAVVVGAGEMAALAMRQLRKRGVEKIFVLNRTVERATELASQWDALACGLDCLGEVLASADIVISSTGAANTIITRSDVEQAMSSRPRQRMVILDIAMPRDIDRSAGDISNVKLWDLDELGEATNQSRADRSNEIPKVECIIEQEIRLFADWYQTAEVEPVIAALHRQAESVRAAEMIDLQDLLAGNCTEEAWPMIERFSRSLIRKLFRQVVVGLREGDGEDGIDRCEAAQLLFGLDLSGRQRASKAASDLDRFSEAVRPLIANPYQSKSLDVDNLARSGVEMSELH